MTEEEISKLARQIKRLKTTFSRRQWFEFYTRHLSETERATVKETVVAKMKELT